MFKFKLFFGQPDPNSAEVADHDKLPATLNAFFDDYYYPHCKATIKSHRHTLLTYEKHLRDTLGLKNLDDLDSYAMNLWLRGQVTAGFKHTTVNKHIFLVNRLLSTARHWGVIREQDYFALKLNKLPTGDYRQRFLSQEEIQRLLLECDRINHPFLSLFIRFLLLTGARKGEARNATWGDIDLNARVWSVPVSKNGRSRRIMLSSGAIGALDETREQATRLMLPVDASSYIFTNPKTRTCYNGFHSAFFKARDAANLSDVRIHDLRHTFASVLINRGVSLYEVQELLGHSTAQMTQRYAHLQPNQLLRRTEIMGNLVHGIG